MADELTWKDLEVGNIITEAGNGSFRKTGDWRTERPILDKEKCIKCALCWIYCPDAAIKPGEDGYYEADLITVRAVVSALVYALREL